MDEQKQIADAVAGITEIRDFLAALQQPALRQAIRDLVPADAPGDPDHGFWHIPRRLYNNSFDFYQECGFDIVRVLVHQDQLSYSDSLGGDLNVYGVLRNAYLYSHPDAPTTERYHDRFDLYLCVAGQYLEGPEVMNVIAPVIQEALKEPTVTRQRAAAKKRLKELFHLNGNHYPHWAQGAEWPMGTRSPMEYLSRARKGEAVLFLFRDVDTGETRTVTQYY